MMEPRKDVASPGAGVSRLERGRAGEHVPPGLRRFEMKRFPVLYESSVPASEQMKALPSR
jgi:hypothetical protein